MVHQGQCLYHTALLLSSILLKRQMLQPRQARSIQDPSPAGRVQNLDAAAFVAEPHLWQNRSKGQCPTCQGASCHDMSRLTVEACALDQPIPRNGAINLNK